MLNSRWIPVITLAADLTFQALAPQAAAASGELSSRQIVNAMIEAHGGLERWDAAPTVSFEDEFKVGDAEHGTVSRVTVEQGERRAYIDFPGSDMRLSWDGRRAWSERWEGPYPPRFLALLNYHFVNLPWLAADPGVRLEEPGTARLWDDSTEYLTVKITYGEGVGDTPDDYYLLYIHPESYRLRATEYIVTYRAILPEGIDSTPPHILVYDGFETVDGLVVPTHYTIYETDQSVYGSCDVRDWSFSEPFDSARMTVPEGAVIDESSP